MNYEPNGCPYCGTMCGHTCDTWLRPPVDWQSRALAAESALAAAVRERDEVLAAAETLRREASERIDGFAALTDRHNALRADYELRGHNLDSLVAERGSWSALHMVQERLIEGLSGALTDAEIVACLALSTGLAECERLRQRVHQLEQVIDDFVAADEAVLALDPLDDESEYDEEFERHRQTRAALAAAVDRR